MSERKDELENVKKRKWEDEGENLSKRLKTELVAAIGDPQKVNEHWLTLLKHLQLVNQIPTSLVMKPKGASEILVGIDFANWSSLLINEEDCVLFRQQDYKPLQIKGLSQALRHVKRLTIINCPEALEKFAWWNWSGLEEVVVSFSQPIDQKIVQSLDDFLFSGGVGSRLLNLLVLDIPNVLNIGETREVDVVPMDTSPSGGQQTIANNPWFAHLDFGSSGQLQVVLPSQQAAEQAIEVLNRLRVHKGWEQEYFPKLESFKWSDRRTVNIQKQLEGRWMLVIQRPSSFSTAWPTAGAFPKPMELEHKELIQQLNKFQNDEKYEAMLSNWKSSFEAMQNRLVELEKSTVLFWVTRAFHHESDLKIVDQPVEMVTSLEAAQIQAGQAELKNDEIPKFAIYACSFQNLLGCRLDATRVLLQSGTMFQVRSAEQPYTLTVLNDDPQHTPRGRWNLALVQCLVQPKHPFELEIWPFAFISWPDPRPKETRRNTGASESFHGMVPKPLQTKLRQLGVGPTSPLADWLRERNSTTEILRWRSLKGDPTPPMELMDQYGHFWFHSVYDYLENPYQQEYPQALTFVQQFQDVKNVPLPQGSILFEGQGKFEFDLRRPDKRVGDQYLRRRVSSTAWQPQAAMDFVMETPNMDNKKDNYKYGVLIVHRIAETNKIVGLSMQAAIEAKDYGAQWGQFWECEVILQPHVYLTVTKVEQFPYSNVWSSSSLEVVYVDVHVPEFVEQDQKDQEVFGAWKVDLKSSKLLERVKTPRPQWVVVPWIRAWTERQAMQLSIPIPTRHAIVADQNIKNRSVVFQYYTDTKWLASALVRTLLYPCTFSKPVERLQEFRMRTETSLICYRGVFAGQPLPRSGCFWLMPEHALASAQQVRPDVKEMQLETWAFHDARFVAAEFLDDPLPNEQELARLTGKDAKSLTAIRFLWTFQVVVKDIGIVIYQLSQGEYTEKKPIQTRTVQL